MRVPGFIGPAYEGQSPIAAGQQCINFYPELIEIEDRARVALYPTPGASLFATVGDTPGRGIFAEAGRLFGVFGRTLYEFDSAGTPTVLGTLVYGTDPVTFATNGDGGNELLVTSGGTGSVYNLSTGLFTLTAVSAVNFCGIINGRFVALDTASSTLRMSASLDGLTWNAAHIIQRSSASDRWTSMILSNGEIFLIGSKTGEVFWDAGNQPIPFEQRSGSLFERGISAPYSISRFGDTIAWLGASAQGEGRVYMMSGYSPVAISTPAIEYKIQLIRADVGISDAIGWSYESQGHVFYVLTFPSADDTFVYDLTTNMWHERAKWDTATATFKSYRPLFHAVAFGKNLVCDSEAGAVYDLSVTDYTDVDGDELRRVRRSPHMSNENMISFYDSFELLLEQGLGLVSGQGSDPMVGLRYSNDGGKTWSTERMVSAGKIGQYSNRAIWRRCGSGRDRVWEVSMSDPIPWRLIDAFVKGRQGDH